MVWDSGFKEDFSVCISVRIYMLLFFSLCLWTFDILLCVILLLLFYLIFSLSDFAFRCRFLCYFLCIVFFFAFLQRWAWILSCFFYVAVLFALRCKTRARSVSKDSTRQPADYRSRQSSLAIQSKSRNKSGDTSQSRHRRWQCRRGSWVSCLRLLLYTTFCCLVI